MIADELYEKISQNNSIPFVEIEVVQDGENGCNIFYPIPMYKEQNKWLSNPTSEAYTKVFNDLDPLPRLLSLKVKCLMKKHFIIKKINWQFRRNGKAGCEQSPNAGRKFNNRETK